MYKEIIESAENGRAVCPICKEELEGKGVFSFTRKDVAVYENSAYCFRCQTLFEPDIEEVKKNIWSYADIKASCYDEKRLGRLQGNIYDGSFIKDKSLTDTALEYLQSRNKFISKKVCDELGIKGNSKQIYIPFNFRTVKYGYYQIRYLDPESKLRYFNPPTDYKPYYQLDAYAGDDCVVYIVEGVFDAIAVWLATGLKVTVIALLGKSLTDHQENMLKYSDLLTGRVVVFLDDTEKSKDLCRSIKWAAYTHNYEYMTAIDYIYSDGADPEEILKNDGVSNFRTYLKECKGHYYAKRI